MKKHIIPTLALTFVITSVTALVSCGEKKSTSGENQEPSTTGLSSIVVKTAPTKAKAITEVRKSPTVGEDVVIEGKIMGRMDPFVTGRAMVMIGDPAVLTSCDIKACGTCDTPWDTCCDEPEDIKASTAIIQVVDTDGKLVKEGLKGIGGMKELSQLVVKGTIAEGSNADNLLINASAIYVKP